MKHGQKVAVVIVAASVALGITFASPAWARSDKQVARASTLRISDFPAGWTTSPATEGSPSKLPACRATVAAAKKAKPYRATAPDFGLSTGGTPTSQVANTVYVFPSVKQAKAYFAAFKLPSAKACLQARLDESTKGSPVQATVETLDVSGSAADDELGLTATIPSSLDTVYFEAVAFRVGRGVTTLATQNVGARFPDTTSLATTSIERLTTNLATG